MAFLGEEEGKGERFENLGWDGWAKSNKVWQPPQASIHEHDRD